MQVANVGNGCASIEGIEVIPENPGSFVQFGGSYSAGASAVNGNFGAGLTGTCGAASSNALSSGSVKSPAVSSSSLSTLATSQVQTQTKAQTTTQTSILATSTATSSANGCTQGAIICTGTGYTWSTCSNGNAVAMGAVAPGTICKNGAITFDTSPASTISSTSTAIAGNVAITSVALKRPVMTTQQVVATPSTSKASTLPTTNCVTKRALLRPECDEFSIKCGTTYDTYHLCSGGAWSKARSLSENEICFDDTVRQKKMDDLRMDTEQVMFQHKVQCFGTGIICANDGRTFYICDSETETPVPSGTRCVDGTIGGGIVPWS